MGSTLRSVLAWLSPSLNRGLNSTSSYLANMAISSHAQVQLATTCLPCPALKRE